MKLSSRYWKDGVKAADLGRPIFITAKALRKQIAINFDAFIEELGGNEFIIKLIESGCSHDLLTEVYKIHKKRTSQFMNMLRQRHDIERPTWKNTKKPSEVKVKETKLLTFRCVKCHAGYKATAPSQCTTCGYNNA